MFSAIKRLAGKSDGSSGQGAAAMPPGHQSMSTSLQRKFAKGVQYNMKVIIKGDRNVGKTCLFHRLQGKKFLEEYLPTEEIQVASIQWNYKATDDIVKVEVWDVVDRGKKKKQFEGLKLDNTKLEIAEEPALDAEFLDVYKGTNGVILMMDITKSWTFDYVQAELPKIPEHIPVIVLANHCDMFHHRTVTQYQISYFIDSLKSRPSQVRYTESSMRNGFGLRLLNKFFNLPFLQLQRVTLLTQLERNQTEIDLTTQELDMYFESDDANYSKFIDQLSNKRRQIADIHSPQNPNANLSATPTSNNSSTMNTNVTNNLPKSQSVPIVIGAGHPIPASGNITKQDHYFSSSNKINTSHYSKIENTPMESGEVSQNQIENKVQPVQSISNKPVQQEQTFMSKFFGNKSVKNNEDRLPEIGKMTLEAKPITSVDEFCPDGGNLDRNFLDDCVEKESHLAKNIYETLDSDSDGATDNPLVAHIQDDVDSNDELVCDIPFNGNRSQVKKNETFENNVTNVGKENTENITDVYNSKGCANNTNYCEEITSDAIDNWLSNDLKWRRSPEGGEDVSVISQNLDYSENSITNDDTGSVTSCNMNTQLLTSLKHDKKHSSNSESEKSNKKDKRKSDDKIEKKHKKDKEKRSSDKKSTKEKDRKKTKKKRSRDETFDRQNDKKRDELEEFLNGPCDFSADNAYEAL